MKFPFRIVKSTILGNIYRPVAQIFLLSKKLNQWTEIWMIVDTGADYSLLPRFMADKLGINLEKECKIFSTYGVGGQERVYFLPKIRAKLGNWEGIIPIGFLERNEIPPLMGRHKFFEIFETHFSSKHFVSFSTK